MSSSPENIPRVGYTIDAKSPVVEIYLLDGEFNLKDHGLGILNGSAPAGLYKVKFKSGAAFVEKLVEFTPPTTRVDLLPAELSFASPVPIDGTITSHEYHRDPAERLSRQVHKSLGTGSFLFFFVRDERRDFKDDPAQSLQLLDVGGTTLAALAAYGVGDASETRESFHGCTFEVNPGTYLLECDLGDGHRLMQSVVACHGWQTQVFLWRRAEGKSEPRPVLTGAGILMTRAGQGFTSSGVDHLKWSELARKSLAQNRSFDSPKDPIIRSMISEKFDDPMLGIYAGHCLLMSADVDRDLLATMVRNLDNLLGSHPDVESIKLTLDAKPVTGSWAVPPMLRSSWSIILRATVEHPESVPEESIASHAASRVWGEGAWFVWQEEVQKQRKVRSKAPLQATLTPSENAVFQYCLNRAEATRFVQSVQRTEGLTVDGLAGPMTKAKINTSVGAKTMMVRHLAQLSPKDMVSSLGLPRSTITAAIKGLSVKLT
jgi:hypothetical protein